MSKIFSCYGFSCAGLGAARQVDWSVQGNAPTSFGSPARQHASAFAAAPGGLAGMLSPGPAMQQQQQPAAALALAPSPLGASGSGAVPPVFAGSFSPSDASSIESSEADDLLNGLHSHVSRPHAAHTAATAALLARGGATRAGLAAKHAAPAPNGGAPADADGIDDVLRLQPWLE
jgi:hypothetical protein